jgi:hypothetical protein
MRRAAASQAAFVDAFAIRVTAAAGKQRWTEKTPQNIRHLAWILAHFPEASVVHIIRDARDVICSMRDHPDRRWVDGAWQKVLVQRPLDWYARRWLDDTAAGMVRRGDARYMEIRYEELVDDPASVLARICEAIGVAAEPGWLDQVAAREQLVGGDADAEVGRRPRPDYEGAVSAGSVGRWRVDLRAAEQQEVEQLCGSRLRELGYEA